MKKISLITIFDNPNFGTYLQALALSVVIEKYGSKVEIIHYERPTWNRYSKLRKKTYLFEPLWELYYKFKNIKGVVQRIGCRNFVSKYIKVTRPYYAYEELLSNPPRADIYVTGSDQVWNTEHNHGVDKAFYLGFAPKGKLKYAYASSIGMSNIPSEYVDETRKLLSDYKAISVREESNVLLLEEIGIQSQVVLDPTLLLSSKDWLKYAKVMNFNDKYVLVYSVESQLRGQEVGKIAKKIANTFGYKVYEVSYFGPNQSIPFCDKHFYYATPDIFLSLVANSSFIVGSSFHITAFAVNFNKPFLSVAPDRFSSRVDNLLKTTHLEDRKVCCVEDCEHLDFNRTINYEKVNDVLQSLRVHSLSFIENVVLNDNY